MATISSSHCLNYRLNKTRSNDVSFAKGLCGSFSLSHFRSQKLRVECSASPEVSSATATERSKLNSLGGVVTDESVPEGHKGLHGFLYGDAGADVHDSQDDEYACKSGEDDGSAILNLDSYISSREGKKFPGVYAIYDNEESLQYVGYSRNIVLSLKAHQLALGQQKCHSVRALMYTGESLTSRQLFEQTRQQWIKNWGSTPPGNSTDLSLWEGPNGPGTAPMAPAERAAYDEKKLKMRKAMGENLYDDVQGESLDSKERRLRLLKAVEGDDWSSVIDSQTKETIKEDATGAIVSPFAKPGAPEFETATESQPLIPMEMTMETVDETLNEVRPYLIADGGNVEVVAVEKGVVMLRLQGACGTCPSSTATMKMGIERSLKNKFGDLLKEVLQVDKQDLGATLMGVESFLDTLRPAIENFKGKVSVASVDTAQGVCELKYKGPPPVGMGVQAAVKDKFPDIRVVKLIAF